MAEINMVPFIDIVLVLLVIFMITAPLMIRGIDVALPKSAVNNLRQEERVVVTVDRNQTLYLDKEKVALQNLETILAVRKRNNPDLALYLQADKGVPYGMIVEVMDRVKKVGIERMGMVTEPLADRVPGK
jgi:biopolymer transport protein TolR